MAQVIKGTFRRLVQQQSFFRYMCNSKTTLYEHRKPMETDLLFANLKNASNTKNVLDIVSIHNGIMNNKHIMQALRSLFILQKQGNTNFSTNEILANKDFKKLCQRLRLQAGSIETNDTLEALKVVSYVGVSSNSTIVQVLLQLLKHDINSLGLRQIIFLDFLLSHLDSSPLTEALKIALPIVFEINLPIKMETDNVAQLTEYLFYLSRNGSKEEILRRVVELLLTFPNFDVKTAKSIIWSICDLDFNEMFRPLLKKAIDCIMIQIDELDFNDLEVTLSKMLRRYTRRFNYFYNEAFFDTCANCLIDQDLGFDKAIYLMRKLNRVNHYHKYLIDYIAQKIQQNSEYVTRADAVTVYTIVTSIAMTDYRPAYWESIKDWITARENIAEENRKEILWMKFAASLCLLDIFRIDVLNKCLNDTCLKNMVKKKFMSDLENYSTIWTSIKLQKPELNCLLPPEYDPGSLWKMYAQPLEFPLEKALHKVIGGDAYVKTCLFSKCGQQIDHAIVFRAGGYPVAFNSNNNDLTCVEDIEVKTDNQLLLILGLRSINYTINLKRLRYVTSFNIKVLESNGFHVLPVCLEMWEKLPDFEKLPYLMQAIKEKTCNELKITENVI